MERMTVNTGVRLTPSQAKKLDRMAGKLRTSRNRLVGLLIETAEVDTLPVVSVDLCGATAPEVIHATHP